MELCEAFLGVGEFVEDGDEFGIVLGLEGSLGVVFGDFDLEAGGAAPVAEVIGELGDEEESAAGYFGGFGEGGVLDGVVRRAVARVPGGEDDLVAGDGPFDGDGAGGVVSGAVEDRVEEEFAEDEFPLEGVPFRHAAEALEELLAERRDGCGVRREGEAGEAEGRSVRGGGGLAVGRERSPGRRLRVKAAMRGRRVSAGREVW